MIVLWFNWLGNEYVLLDYVENCAVMMNYCSGWIAVVSIITGWNIIFIRMIIYTVILFLFPLCCELIPNVIGLEK